MIDFSICIELAFADGDRPLDERVRAAADAGFPAVEIWHWRDKPLQALKRALQATGTSLHTLCVEDWRDKCRLGDPQSHDRFVHRVVEAAETATELDCKRLVVLAGDRIPGLEPDAQRTAAAQALLRAADAISGRGQQLLLEVVNRDHEGPNALISDTASAISLLRTVARPEVNLLYDRYHAILNGEPLGWAITDNMDLVAHLQLADVPGRHEFGTGTHDWAKELDWLVAANYSGLLGIEALPLGDDGALYAEARVRLEAAMARRES